METLTVPSGLKNIYQSQGFKNTYTEPADPAARQTQSRESDQTIGSLVQTSLKSKDATGGSRHPKLMIHNEQIASEGNII